MHLFAKIREASTAFQTSLRRDRLTTVSTGLPPLLLPNRQTYCGRATAVEKPPEEPLVGKQDPLEFRGYGTRIGDDFVVQIFHFTGIRMGSFVPNLWRGHLD